MDDKKPASAPAKDKGKEEPAKAADSAAPAKSNLSLLIGIIVIGVVLQAGVQFMVVRMNAPKAEIEEEEGTATGEHVIVPKSETEMGTTTAEMPLEVLVNIAGTEGERFLKAALVMEFLERTDGKKKKEGGHGGGHGEKKEGGGEGIGDAIKQRMPKYQNYLLESLAKLTLAEISAPETKDKIRRDFIRMVNSSLPPYLGVVKDIYFTQYIIQ